MVVWLLITETLGANFKGCCGVRISQFKVPPSYSRNGSLVPRLYRPRSQGPMVSVPLLHYTKSFYITSFFALIFCKKWKFFLGYRNFGNKDQQKTILKFWITVSVTPKFISKLWETHGGHTRTSPNFWKVFDGCPRKISKLQKIKGDLSWTISEFWGI